MDHWITNVKQYLNIKEMEKSLLIVEMWKLKKIEEKEIERIHSQSLIYSKRKWRIEWFLPCVINNKFSVGNLSAGFSIVYVLIS
jgi:hypothetical protein